MDAFVTAKISKAFQVRVGQYYLPLGYENYDLSPLSLIHIYNQGNKIEGNMGKAESDFPTSHIYSTNFDSNNQSQAMVCLLYTSR